MTGADLGRESAAAWRRAGQVVQVQGVTIGGGMIYVGSALRSKNGYGAPDNCLIDPALTANAGGGDPDAGLTYWASYSRIPPSTRRAYLQWLASDRADPATSIGYVFLYFYGLERRLMLDEFRDDAPAVLAEVERLRTVYGANASFRGYASRLIGAAGVMAGATSSLTPSFERAGELPLSARVALGRLAVAREPIAADWMLSWLMSSPDRWLRTPAGRDLDQFRELFARRWSAAKPAVFTDSQLARLPRLQCKYRAASNSFEVARPIGDNLPDVSGHQPFVEAAHRIALACCDELDAYSRQIGRHPELKGSVLAAATLPQGMVARERARASIAERAANREGQSLAALIGFVEANGPPEKVTPARWRRAAEALRAFGYGMMPDPELTLARVEPGVRTRVYVLPDGSDATPEPMTATALALQIGALVAAADGVVTEAEREELLRAAGVGSLDARQNARLRAQATWLLDNPARPADLKSRLAAASPETQAWVVDTALDIARGDGRVLAAEVKQLERIFGWLGLPSTQLYSALHAAEPTEVVPEIAAPGGSAIPAKHQRRLDPDRIARITRDSAKSASLLQSVFAAEEDESEQPLVPPPATAGGVFDGLSEKTARFAQAICERDEWPRRDLETLAQAQGMMLEGTIEGLNDWALDRCGDLLVEDGEPIRVNRHLLLESVRTP